MTQCVMFQAVDRGHVPHFLKWRLCHNLHFKKWGTCPLSTLPMAITTLINTLTSLLRMLDSKQCKQRKTFVGIYSRSSGGWRQRRQVGGRDHSVGKSWRRDFPHHGLQASGAAVGHSKAKQDDDVRKTQPRTEVAYVCHKLRFLFRNWCGSTVFVSGPRCSLFLL